MSSVLNNTELMYIRMLSIKNKCTETTLWVEGTNLSKAESHRVWVVILRDKDVNHKMSQFVSQAIYHHEQQKEGGKQRL